MLISGSGNMVMTVALEKSLSKRSAFMKVAEAVYAAFALAYAT
jgi:hypothetical protein